MLIRSILLLLIMFFSLSVNAGLGDWFKNEVIPTFKGERPLKIDPNRVTITENGKKILDLDLKKDTLYIEAGDVTFKTGQLKKDLARAGAIFSGNTAVLGEIAAEQIQKELAKAQKDGLVTVSKSPPKQKVEIPPEIKNITPIEIKIGRELTIYNQTPVPIKYALNDEVFELDSGEGFKHTNGSDEFFLQFDDNLQGKFNIARYFLTGTEYGLLVDTGDKFVSVKKYK
tara:strand:+ start:10130 stop:10813 length:684 start_codon:yes stop_codon:yes gene_type:complete